MTDKLLLVIMLCALTFSPLAMANSEIFVKYQYRADDSLPVEVQKTKYKLIMPSGGALSLFDNDMLNPVREVFNSQGWVESTSPDIVVVFQPMKMDSSTINDELHYDIKGPTGISSSNTTGRINADGSYNAATKFQQNYGSVGTGVFSMPRNQYSIGYRLRAIDAKTLDSNYPLVRWDVIITCIGGDPNRENYLKAALIATRGILGSYGRSDGSKSIPVSDAISWELSSNSESRLEQARKYGLQILNSMPQEDRDRMKAESQSRIDRYLEAVGKGMTREDAQKIFLNPK